MLLYVHNMESQETFRASKSKFIVELKGAALSIHLSVLNLIGSKVRDAIQMVR